MFTAQYSSKFVAVSFHTSCFVDDETNCYAVIAWISVAISYGLFLADHTVLDIQESEFVILPAIMCQNLKGATQWHLRGCLRVGMTREEVDDMQKVVEVIVAFGGHEPLHVGRVWDIEEDT